MHICTSEHVDSAQQKVGSGRACFSRRHAPPSGTFLPAAGLLFLSFSSTETESSVGEHLHKHSERSNKHASGHKYGFRTQTESTRDGETRITLYKTR